MRIKQHNIAIVQFETISRQTAFFYRNLCHLKFKIFYVHDILCSDFDKLLRGGGDVASVCFSSE